MSKPRKSRSTSVAKATRAGEIGAVIEAVRETCDVAARLAVDPVRFVHRYTDAADREIVAVLASSLAFGNVKAFCGKIEDALRRLEPEGPSRAAEDRPSLEERFAGFKHRFCSGGDLAALLLGTRAAQRAHGSLGACFAAAVARANAREHVERGEPVLAGLIALTEEIRKLGGLSKLRTHGAKHILPAPEKGGANKRLLLMLRWMIRPADGVDLGMWNVDPALLVMPMDVHLHRLARNLGFTKRNAADWATAIEVTEHLAKLDPRDPVKYDFALCHLGMVGDCPSRRDPTRCEGCGVQPVCVHWSRAKQSRRATLLPVVSS